ncbi:phage portal protein family protein, partial [Aeromonas veronii]
LRDGSQEGVALNPFGWLLHKAKSKSGYLARTGLVRTLVWPFLFKNYSVRDLAEFLEIYGLPVRLGKYPEGATEKEKATLLQAVLSIGHNAGGIIPRGMEIEFENAASGQADPFVVMMDWCERSMSKAILGGTLTSQADGKSSTNALGNVHNEVRQEVRDADLRQLAATLTRDLVYPLYALNGKSYQGPRRCPRLEFDVTEPEDMRDLAYPLRALVGMGMQIPAQWVRDKLQIPAPKEGEEVLIIVDKQAGQGEAALKAKGLAALAAERQMQDRADLLTGRLSAAGEDAIEGWTQEVEQLLGEVTSLDEFRDRLLERYRKLPTEELAMLMQRALVAAELAGMADVGSSEEA